MKKYTHLELGRKIKHWREQKGFTNLEFARKIEISDWSLDEIERGHRTPPLILFCKICNVLEVDANELIGSGGRIPCQSIKSSSSVV